MASSWKKIFEKFDKSPVDAPFSSDWEAMNQKIEAYPGLKASKRKGGFWFRTGLAGALVVMTALGLFLFWPGETTEPHAPDTSGTENSQMEEVPLADEVPETDDRDKSDDNDAQDPHPQPKANPKNKHIEEGFDNASPTDIADNTSGDEPEPARVQNDEAILRPQVSAAQGDELPEEEASDVKETGPATKSGRSSADGDLTTAKSAEKPSFKNPLDQNPYMPVMNDNPRESVQRLTTEEKISIGHPSLTELIFTLEEAPDPELTPAAVPEFMDLSAKGFRITGLSAGAKLLTDFSGGFYALGQGVDVDVQRGGWLFNAGLHHYQLNADKSFDRFVESTRTDTSLVIHTETRTEQRVDSAWVIRGPQQGGFVYDTTEVSVVDSTFETRIDSSTSTIKLRENKRLQVSYIEMPVLAGHRFRFHRFAIDVLGGVALHKSTSSNPEGADLQTRFGVDAILQPAVRYYALPHWSLFGRAGMRYGLTSDEVRGQQFYSDFQLGVTYHW